MSKDDCIIIEERFDDPEQNAARDYIFEQMGNGENCVFIYSELLHFSKKVYRNIKVGHLLNFLLDEYIKGGRKPFYPDFEKYIKYMKISNIGLKNYVKSLIKKKIFHIIPTKKGSLFILDEEEIYKIIIQYKKKSNVSELEY